MNIPPLTEDAVLDQTAKIRQADVARKVDIVQFFSLQLEATQELTPTAIDAITAIIPSLLASHSHLLYQSTLSSLLPTYLPLLAPHTPEKLRNATLHVFPPLLEKLADAKERVHKPAEESIVALGHLIFSHPSTAGANLSSSGKGKSQESAAQVYERLVIGALEGKSSRSKVGAMRVLVGVRSGTRALGLKAFLPVLVGLLEDSDGAVREEAKATLIHLLSPEDIPPSAHHELRKMMQSRGMKPALVEGIMGSLVAPEEAVVVATEGAPGAGEEGVNEVAKVMMTSERELEHEFAALVQPFTGKETEHNWQAREAAVVRVRGMVQGGMYKKFGASFISALRQEFWAESVKGLLSLRTTLAMATCAMYADTARVMEEAFDQPLMETLLPHLIKLSGSTKKIVVEASQRQVVATIIDHAGCHPRVFVPFLAAGLGERTVQSRQHFMDHVGRYLKTQAGRPQGKQTIEHTTLLNSPFPTAIAQLTDLIRRGLTDPNPGVKESARTAFGVFYREWPKQAAILLGGLEEGVRRQVEKTLAEVKGSPRANAAEESSTTNTPTARPPPMTRRTAPGGRKPSSAIAAAIRKAKEEARTARLAEAEAQKELEQAEDVGQEEVAVHLVQNGTLDGQAAVDNSTSEDLTETPDPIKSPVRSPVAPSARRQATSPETPTRPLSLLDIQTPESSSTAFKVMTPAPVAGPFRTDLLETTRTSQVEPVQDVPPSLVLTPETKKEQAIDAPAEAEAASPLVEVTVKQRRPRVSVNPVAEMERPKPLYAKLRTLVDCSFWLDRRQEYMQESVSVPLSELLARSASTVTLQDVSGFIAWSNQHPQNQLERELTDDDIREHVQAAFQNGCDAKAADDTQVAELIDTLESTIVSHDNEEVLKAGLFLLWNMVIYQPRHWINREDRIIRSCLALRRSDSSSIRRGSAGLLALVAETTPEPVHVLHLILTCSAQALESAQASIRSRLEVFALVNIAGIVCKLPRTIVEDQVPLIKPLLLQALNSRSIPSREAAYTTLVALQSSIDDSSVLLGNLFPELTDAQRNLGMYMIKRDLKGTGADGEEGEGWVKEMQRLSRRL